MKITVAKKLVDSLLKKMLEKEGKIFILLFAVRHALEGRNSGAYPLQSRISAVCLRPLGADTNARRNAFIKIGTKYMN